MKNAKNALRISLVLTVLVLVYFLVSGESMQENELLSYAIGLFAGVFAYLWLIGRRSK